MSAIDRHFHALATLMAAMARAPGEFEWYGRNFGNAEVTLYLCNVDDREVRLRLPSEHFLPQVDKALKFLPEGRTEAGNPELAMRLTEAESDRAGEFGISMNEPGYFLSFGRSYDPCCTDIMNFELSETRLSVLGWSIICE